jgi:hypothetical protein
MTRSFWPCVVLVLAAAFHLPALADLIPPQAAEAAKRLEKNPRAFDRTDEYCKGKKVADACTLPGNAFAGGGEGVCQNNTVRWPTTIDLTCVREDTVVIERKLPKGGFVNDTSLCSDAGKIDSNGIPEPSRWNCSPIVPTPRDQFCAGKEVGAACTVQLRNQDRQEEFPGVCKEEVQSYSFYYQGQRTATRKVVQCESPESLPPRTYAPASWWQKLTQ